MCSVHAQVEGSHLASMFSGRWEDCLDRDSNGRVFLAFDPYSFQQILTMLRCRLFDIANSAAPYKAIITPDKLHAYKCLVDYLGLEGVCRITDKPSNLPSDACQLTYVSDGAIVTQSMAKGQWVPSVTPFKIYNVVANAGPEMSTGQKYHIKLETSRQYWFVGIAKETPTDAQNPGKSAFGWTQDALGGRPWAAGVAKCNDFVPVPRLRNRSLQVDVNTSCLACVDLDSTHSARNGKPQGWKMPFFSSPGLADVMQQQFFTFQMIVEPNGRSTVLPVTDADKELFVDKW